jgi:hypothetical protein
MATMLVPTTLCCSHTERMISQEKKINKNIQKEIHKQYLTIKFIEHTAHTFMHTHTHTHTRAHTQHTLNHTPTVNHTLLRFSNTQTL